MQWRTLACGVALSVSLGCSSVHVVPSVPPPPRPDTDTALELILLEGTTACPLTRAYVDDVVTPYMDGIEAMRE